MTGEDETAIRALIFGLCITITALITARCGQLSDIGPQNIPLQPPDWVFGVVWPCLYVTTGIAWYKGGSSTDIALGVVTLLSCAWLVVYACLRNKRLAAVILTFAAITTLIAAIYFRKIAGWLMPLAAWLAFASYLNIADIVGQ